MTCDRVALGHGDPSAVGPNGQPVGRSAFPPDEVLPRPRPGVPGHDRRALHRQHATTVAGESDGADGQVHVGGIREVRAIDPGVQLGPAGGRNYAVMSYSRTRATGLRRSSPAIIPAAASVRPSGAKVTEFAQKSPFSSITQDPMTLYVPEPQGKPGDDRQRLAVGGIGDRLHRAWTGVESPGLTPTCHIPQVHDRVVTAGGERPAVGCEGDGGDQRSLTAERPELPGGMRRPRG